MTRREQLPPALSESYAVEFEIEGAGMSRVFVATDRALSRRVVVKTLPRELAAERSIGRFRREIRLAAQLQHPCIVPVLTAGVADGLPYYTMPFVEGESLRARLARRGEVDVAEAVQMLHDVASALAHAHAHGVVHRDIKPDNVLLSAGYAMVSDFGVAKAISASAGERSGLTTEGFAVGTPGYMAPEQASADPDIDERVDLYSLGCIAYEMLAGEPPFVGRNVQATIAAHVAERPAPIVARRPGVPPLLEQLVMRCLEKRPTDRPASAREVADILQALGTGAIRATTRGDGVRGVRWFARYGRWGWMVAVLAVAAIAYAGRLLAAKW